MEFGVLGPVRVAGETGPVEIKGVKERTLLAHLVAHVGHTVPLADLIDSLWGEEPPRTAAKSLQTFVLRLRQALEPDRGVAASVIVTDPGGYRLAVAPSSVDAHRFAELATLGHVAMEEGRHDAAVATLREALDLWRGAAYAGAEDTPFGATEGRRLEELRLAVLEDRWRAELEVGHEAAAVSQLEQLVDQHPYRERLWALLVLALYRADRQGDALAAYDRARGVLDDQLGVEPGEELRRIHARVLQQDPTLLRSRVAIPASLVAPRRPLVGRAVELTLLESAWQRALSGDAVTVLMTGPAGAGASRLAQELATSVARSGRPVTVAGDSEAVAPAGGLMVSERPVRPATTGSMVLQLARPGAEIAPAAVGLELQPLGPEAVRTIVASYVPPAEVDEATRFVRAAGAAWPGAVHDAALGWARDTARAKVASGASRLDAATSQLGAARAEIVDGVVALGSAAALATSSPDECPWRGLAAYDVDDAPWFAGRERLVAELLARVASGRLVAVVGASGSGKSSLMRAGLLAGLSDGRLPGSDSWSTTVLRPGDHPMRELARSALGMASHPPEPGDLLAHLLDNNPVAPRSVLVIDQLEEAWTLCVDVEERVRFLDLLADLVETPGTGHTGAEITVVVAIRADYVAQLAEHPRLARALADDTLLVGSPTVAEVERTIHLPAAAAGLDLELGLADAIVSDAGDEPGLLPLLSVALTQLWSARDGQRLTLAAYVGMGGLAGAIVHLAEQAFTALPAAQQETARTVFLRLTGSGEGSTVVRRRVAEAEIAALPDEASGEVVRHFTDARLLTRADGHVEVAHESLFREWPRLAEWIREDAAARAVRHRLAAAARDWDTDGRDDGELWRGVRLDSGVEVGQGGVLTGIERAFLDASTAAVEAETNEAEQRAASAVRQNRRLRSLLVGLAILLALALVAGIIALVARGEAAEATDRAEASAVAANAKRLAAQALNEDFFDTALLEAVEAVKVEQSPETYGALLSLLGRAPTLVSTVRTEKARFLQAATSPDGGTVFLGDNRRVWAFDADSGDELWQHAFTFDGEVGQPGEIAAGDAGLLVPVGTHPSNHLVLLDPTTGEEVWSLASEEIDWDSLAGPPAAEPRLLRHEAVWLEDGRIATFAADKLLLLEPDGSMADSRHIGVHADVLRAWPDGRVSLAVDPGVGAILDLSRPGPREPLPHLPLAVAPRGDRLVTARETPSQYSLQLRDLDFRPIGRQIVMPSFVQRVAWSPDGTQFAITLDEEVQVRDASRGELVTTLDGVHSGATIDATFAARGGLLWVAGREGLGTAWDLRQPHGVIVETPVRVEPHLARTSVRGELTAYLRYNSFELNGGAVADLASGRDTVGDLEQVEGCQCQIGSVAMAPDDALVLGAVHEWKSDFSGIRDDRGKVAIWSVVDGSLEDTVDLPWYPRWIDTTPDGRFAVVNGVGGWAVLDLERRTLVGEPVADDPLQGGAEPLAQVRVSPDGTEAALMRNGTIVVIDPTTGDELRRGEVAAESFAAEEGGTWFGLTSAAWTSDQDTLVVGSYTGSTYFLDSQTFEPVAPPRQEIDGWVLQTEISPDGRWLATMGTDGDVLLWDTETWAPLGNAVMEDGSWGVLAFTDDSTSLTGWFEQLEQDRRGVARTISLDPDDWIAQACQLANRQLTEDEWAVIHPGQEWRETCA